MFKSNIKAPMLLSTLWIFILFNMIFRDLHQFVAEGYIEEMMQLKISEEAMLFYGFILEIPIIMVLLSRILNNKINKWTNIVAAIIVMLGFASTIFSGDLDDIFFSSVNIAASLAIIFIAWRIVSFDHSQILSGAE